MAFWSRRTPRRRQEGLRDQKTFRLYRAACRLLARYDHEQIPVASFAEAAEMSVGAIYERFRNKDAFLSAVVSLRLSGACDRLEQKLDPKRWQSRSARAVTRAIVVEMMQSLHGHGAGVVRTALKRGHADRSNLEPLERYRSALADRAVTLLAHRVTYTKRPERAVRETLQMAEATAMDALLHERGMLRPGSQHMAATLSTMMLSVLQLSGEPAANDDDAAEPDDDDTDGMLDIPIEEVVAHPIPDEPPPARISTRAGRESHTGPVEHIPTVKPASTHRPREDEEPTLPKQGRHRPQF